MKRLFILFLILSFLSSNLMAGLEDFGTYTEEDVPADKITVTTNKIEWVDIDRDESAWVVKDKGVDHFDGDFEHLVEHYLDSDSLTNSFIGIWYMANEVNDTQAIAVGGSMLCVFSLEDSGGNARFQLRETDSGANYSQWSGNYSTNTLYYLKMERNESVGTYGTFYCYIYDDAERTNLLQTLTITLHTSKKDYRYIYAFGSNNVPTSPYDHTGYTQNLDLQEAEPPPPTGVRVESQIIMSE